LNSKADMKAILSLAFVLTFAHICVGFETFPHSEYHEHLNNLIERTSDTISDSECDRQLTAFSDALSKREMWAVESETSN
jgi:hypothetical protein